MAKNSEQVRIFGGDDDKVWIGPRGSTLPTTLADPTPPMKDAGWLGQDGIALTPSVSVDKKRAHQGAAVVRTVVTESGTSFKFQMLEFNADSFGLQFNVRSAATSEGLTTMEVASSYKIQTRAFVIDGYDAEDDSIHHRIIVPRGEVGERSEIKLANSDLTVIEFTVEIIDKLLWITNDTAFEVIP